MTRNVKILIVDDEVRNRQLLDVFMTTAGYQTVLASSGIETLALAVTEQPDAILMDLMMPNMDGFQVLQHLKENPATQRIPVIVVSALDDTAARQRVLASGAVACINQPVDRWALSQCLQQLLNRTEAEDGND